MVNFLITAFSILSILAASRLETIAPRTLPIISSINPEVSRFMAFGHDNFFSDAYWLQFLQASDEKSPFKKELRSPEYFLLKNSVTHDKRNCFVYHQGGSFISVLKRDVYGAEDIFLEGTKNCKYSGRFQFLLGYHYMEEMGDMKKAAVAFDAASKYNDSPPHLKGLASRLFASSGDLYLSRGIVAMMHAQTNDKILKSTLNKRMKLIDMEILLLELNKTAERYETHLGRKITSLQDLIKERYLIKIPKEPTAHQWVVDKNGRIDSSNPERYRINTH